MKRFLTLWWSFYVATAPAGAPPFGWLPALVTDVLVGETRFLSDQSDKPYCSLYAASTYFELWFNSRYPHAPKSPAISTGFFALAYNAEYASGNTGTADRMLWYSIAQHGILTTDAWEITPFPKGAEHLKNSWRNAHTQLIDERALRSVLSMRFWHPEFKAWYSAAGYLKGRMQFNFEGMKMIESRRAESFLPWTGNGTGNAAYRIPDAAARDAQLDKLEKAGALVPVETENADKLYAAIRDQLYRSEPVLLSMNPMMSRHRFASYTLLSNPDLVDSGKASASYHAMVAIGVCDGGSTTLPTCAPFTSQFAERGITECLLLQNSWGTEVHERGLACLSPAASQRMINWALLRDI